MKKLIPLFFLLLAAVESPAQAPAPAPEKEILIVDCFLRNRTAPLPYVETLRGEVLAAFVNRGRHNVLNGTQTMPSCPPGMEHTSPETVSADLEKVFEMRVPEAAAAGARYLICGAIVDYKFEHVMLPSPDSKKPPLKGFKSSFRILISGFDLKLGERIPDEFYELTASAPIAEDADRAALGRLDGQIGYYIDRNFKFETQVLELCPPDKKGRIRELYIYCGTQMGVKVGDLFVVYEEVPIGGIMTRQKIGRLRVNDVNNPTVARCKIAKGDAEIIDAFTRHRVLICLSDGKAFGF